MDYREKERGPDSRDNGTASSEELEIALRRMDEKVICGYFQRSELWSAAVSPVLLAAATLQAMLSSGPQAHWQCYSQAVQLLHYIHSECPQVGMEEEEYIEMVVDFKTKAVLYELFQEMEFTDEMKDEVLTKYLGKASHEKTKKNYTNLAEYRVALYAYARRGLESMLDSDQQCLTFRRTHLFNSENSRQINSSMLIDLNNYLDLVRTHLANISHPLKNTAAAGGSGACTTEPNASPIPEAEAHVAPWRQSGSAREDNSETDRETDGGTRVLRSGKVQLRESRRLHNNNGYSTDTTATTASSEEDAATEMNVDVDVTRRDGVSCDLRGEQARLGEAEAHVAPWRQSGSAREDNSETDRETDGGTRVLRSGKVQLRKSRRLHNNDGRSTDTTVTTASSEEDAATEMNVDVDVTRRDGVSRDLRGEQARLGEAEAHVAPWRQSGSAQEDNSETDRETDGGTRVLRSGKVQLRKSRRLNNNDGCSTDTTAATASSEEDDVTKTTVNVTRRDGVSHDLRGEQARLGGRGRGRLGGRGRGKASGSGSNDTDRDGGREKTVESGTGREKEGRSGRGGGKGEKMRGNKQVGNGLGSDEGKKSGEWKRRRGGSGSTKIEDRTDSADGIDTVRRSARISLSMSPRFHGKKQQQASEMEEELSDVSDATSKKMYLTRRRVKLAQLDHSAQKHDSSTNTSVADESETISQSEEIPAAAAAAAAAKVVVTRTRAAGLKRQRESAESTECSDSPESGQRSPQASRAKLTERSLRMRPKRRVVYFPFDDDDDSSEEATMAEAGPPHVQQQTEIQERLQKNTNEFEQDRRQEWSESTDSGQTTPSSPQRNRRKQITPRKWRSVGQKLEASVHFSHANEQTATHSKRNGGINTQHGCSPGPVSDSKTRAPPAPFTSTVTAPASRGRLYKDNEVDSGSRSTYSLRVLTRSGNSSSECEGNERSTRRTPTRKRPTSKKQKSPAAPPTPHLHSFTIRHRVVDLADSYTEFSQPGSQWDYVAVQTVAATDKARPAARASHKVPGAGGGGVGRSLRRERGSEVGSDPEGTSASDEVALVSAGKDVRYSSDKHSVVSESSTGSTSPVTRPALKSIYSLRRRGL